MRSYITKKFNKFLKDEKLKKNTLKDVIKFGVDNHEKRYHACKNYGSRGRRFK